MPVLFRRHSVVTCFFCHSPCTLPANPRNFRCPMCACWNRYDENGDIISEEPAMHVESLNSNSFAKRASANYDQIPTMYNNGKGPFCHVCQSNQLLIINLLSNYLPSFNDPEYATRLEMLPQYRESLHLRYPPVCDECLPAVEDEIQRKDQMARRKALGGWLNESKGKEKQRRVSEIYVEKESLGLATEIIAWRIRGTLWVLTLALTAFGNLTAALGYECLKHLAPIQPALPVVVIMSLFWTVWDPTYASLRRAQRQGRDIRVRGKALYIKMQMVAWSSRCVTSALLASAWYNPTWDILQLHTISSITSRLYFGISFFMEMMTFMTSCFVIRLQQPPAVRLIDTKRHTLSESRSVTPNIVIPLARPDPRLPAEPTFLAALSLSSRPIFTQTNPIFGLPSLLSSLPPSSEVDADAMDWTPTNSNDKQDKLPQDDGSWLRPQRFFAPEKPTGLEGLFERTLLVDEKPIATGSETGRNSALYSGKHYWKWWWVYFSLLLFAPLGGIVYKKWQTARRNTPIM